MTLYKTSSFSLDADPDHAFHFDADPDPTFQFDADPDPTTLLFPDFHPLRLQNNPLSLQPFHFDADADSDQTTHQNDADPCGSYFPQ
jgi:hypothetical protein